MLYYTNHNLKKCISILNNRNSLLRLYSLSTEIGKRVLKEFAYEMNFVSESDALTHILKNNLKVCETQVSMEQRESGVSYFDGIFKSGKFMINVLISIIFIQ